MYEDKEFIHQVGKKKDSLLILCLHCGRHLKQPVVIMLPVKQLGKITSAVRERERELTVRVLVLHQSTRV